MEDPLNAEFKRLLSKSGWSQSEAARRLFLTSGTVSQYMSNDTRPSRTTLALFKMLLGEVDGIDGIMLKEGSLPPLEEWERDLVTELREVSEDERRHFIHHMRGVAKLLPRRKIDYRK